MKSFLSGLSRLMALVFALLLVIGLPLSLLAYDVGRVVFNPPLVKRVLTEIVTQSDLIPAGLAWFSEVRAAQHYNSGRGEAWVTEPDVTDLIAFMSIDDWRAIRQEVLLDEFLADWVSTSVDGTYNWIDSEERVPQIVWNLRDFKRHAYSEHGKRSIAIAYSALPPCTMDQITDFKNRLAAAPPGTEVLYNLCAFPDPWYEDQFSDYLESLEEVVVEIPETFPLTEQLSRVQDTAGVGPEAIKTELRLIRRLLRLAPLIPLTLLVLVLIFAVRNLKGLGLWWGTPLLAGGLVTLLLRLSYHPIIVALLSRGPLSEVPPLIRGEAVAAVLRLAGEVFKPMLWQAVVILVVAVALVIVGGMAKSNPAQPPEPAAVE